MEYMLNELSLGKVQHKIQAHGLMENFVHAVVYAEELLRLNRLRIDESIGKNLYDVYFMEGYSIGTWLHDRQVSKDLKEKFLTIISSSPLIKEEELKARFENENCLYKGRLGLGIKAAFIYESLCVNFLTEACWNVSSLQVQHEYWENEEIKTAEESIPCFANKFHIASHREWIQNKPLGKVKSGEELWDKKEEFFPHLFFCISVKQNLRTLGFSTNLTNIIERLKVLDSVGAEWKSGDFNYETINQTQKITIHPETPLTLDNYSAMRCFRLPDGRREIFSLHVITGNLRIHFYPDHTSHSLYIGYIGPHLRTWSY